MVINILGSSLIHVFLLICSSNLSKNPATTIFKIYSELDHFSTFYIYDPDPSHTYLLSGVLNGLPTGFSVSTVYMDSHPTGYMYSIEQPD